MLIPGWDSTALVTLLRKMGNFWEFLGKIGNDNNNVLEKMGIRVRVRAWDSFGSAPGKIRNALGKLGMLGSIIWPFWQSLA